MPVSESVVAIAMQWHAATVSFSHFRKRPVLYFLRWSEPEIPIELLRNRNHWNHGRSVHSVDAAGYSLNFADSSMLNQRDSLKETVVALGTLHRSNLKDAARLLYHFFDQLALGDREG